MIDQIAFTRILDNKDFFRKLRSSSLPFVDVDERVPSRAEQRQFVSGLYRDVVSGAYHPQPPRGYLVEDKGHGVARIIPVLSVRDSCIYLFCVKSLEVFLSGNRVHGTFGGWQLGSPIREAEERERNTIFSSNSDDEEDAGDDSDGFEYGGEGSYHPTKWYKNWKDYQNWAHGKSRDILLSVFVHFDIGNFYDSIDLSLLERRVLSACHSQNMEIIDLLFLLLRGWNRELGGYRGKSIGLPQDEVSDCSRLLANFYLQEYDQIMKRYCDDILGGAVYLRYSDDQIVMTRNQRDVERVLHHASAALHRIGLNINSSKVHVIHEQSNFDHYWSFAIFRMLDVPSQVSAASLRIAEQIRAERSDRNYPQWRKDSVLRRLLTVGLGEIDPLARGSIVSEVISPNFLVNAKARELRLILDGLEEDEIPSFLGSIEILIDQVPHNRFHLSVQKALAEHIEPSMLTLSQEAIRRSRQLLAPKF